MLPFFFLRGRSCRSKDEVEEDDGEEVVEVDKEVGQFEVPMVQMFLKIEIHLKLSAH